MLNRLQKKKKPRPHSTTENKTRFFFNLNHGDGENTKGRLSLDADAKPDPSSPSSINDDAQNSPLDPVALLGAESMSTSVFQRKSKPLPSPPIPSPASPDSLDPQPRDPRRMTSTIRAVPSHDDRGRPSLEYESSEWSPSARHSASAFSSSVQSDYSALSTHSQPAPATPATNGAADSRPKARIKQSQTVTHLAAPAHGMAKPQSRAASPDGRRSFDIPARESSLGVMAQPSPTFPATSSPSQMRRNAPPTVVTKGSSPRPAPQDSSHDLSHSATDTLSNGWDSTVGKAALSGKTGRVINRLVSENEALKRDIQIERLKAEESRQSARLLEDKMERIVSEYESALLDANITKTLLAKKERKVESLQAAVELEKQRTADARDKERTWRDEMEKVTGDAKRTAEQAKTEAALYEGRYNAISGHWREQGEEVEKALGRVRKEMAELLEERARDDDKINTLRELCEQQDGNIRDLRRQNEAAARKFDEYKAAQEDALRDIKTKAAQREEEQLRALEEAKAVLHKLKWALNVNENVKGLQ